MISLKSKITQKLLVYFFTNKSSEHYAAELARLFGEDSKNTHTKLRELKEEGLLKSRVQGKETLYSLNGAFPLLKEYESIVQKTVGVEAQLKLVMNNIRGITQAYIFGSYARNQLTPTSDIDVLVIGDHDILEVQKKVLKLQKAVNREINVIDMSEEEFENKKAQQDPFLQKVLKDHPIALIG
jgi:predicted nucleotidyltransferase